MNGLPGPYIKDFMKRLGHSGVYDDKPQFHLVEFV